MKKILIAAFLFINTVTFVRAQISAGLTIGPAIPSGSYSKFAGIGFGFAAEGRYAINDMLSVGMNTGHYRTPLKDLSIPLRFQQGIFAVAYRGNFNVTSITTVAEYFILDEDIRPYAGLEIGAYITGYKWVEDEKNVTSAPEFSESVTRLGVAPTIGALYEINDGLELSASLKYIVSGGRIIIDDADGNGVHMFTINFGVRITPSEF